MTEKQKIKLLKKYLVPTPPEIQEIFDQLLAQMPAGSKKFY